ncbi:MAG: NAD(P)/FAD-dependent oxidoreductase [Nitrospirae bacterium]|nr:NAD(P)/FAD-dependent oxidoreductase [Nitrospirota bacterium]
MNRYDVIIVGAGPAGIFAALELLKKDNNINILMIDKGKDIHNRICPMKVKKTKCITCPECALLSGWGGAGAFSDGKLTLSADIGGFLSRYIDKNSLENLINYTDSIYIKYGAPDHIYGEDEEAIKNLSLIALKYDLSLIPSKIRHIGTDRCRIVLENIKTYLGDKVDILFLSEAEKILTQKNRTYGIKLKNGTKYLSEYLILAPGREGSRWLEKEVKRLKLSVLQNPVDIGVRVELPANVLEKITEITYEPKLIFHSKKFNDRVRTFCVNPYGEVVKEYLKGIWTVNGHSYTDKKTSNTNFAILVSTTFTEPFKDPISYGRYIAGLANLLGKGVLIQRLGDLRNGRRSTAERIEKGGVIPTLSDATPGDLSFALPYRYITDITEMLEALDFIAPGVNSENTLLYGVEVKFYSIQLKLSNQLETEIKNLFAIGDGAGVSRGLIQASASGVIAAREILKRMSN